jgi:hypothetical protein
LSNIRKGYSYLDEHELKWSGIRKYDLSMCSDFINEFLRYKKVRYVVVAFRKGYSWQQWAKNDDEKFLKPYYRLLLSSLHPFYSYIAYIDEHSLKKRYGWNRLRYLINKNHHDSWQFRFRSIKALYPTSSHSNDLMQLTDIILGSISHSGMSESKLAIIKMLSQCREQKYSYLLFSPSPRKQFSKEKFFDRESNNKIKPTRVYDVTYDEIRHYLWHNITAIESIIT